jgi:hypothetical protein
LAMFVTGVQTCALPISQDDLLDRLFDKMQDAGGKAGMDIDRFLEQLAAGRTGFDAQREMLSST